MTNRTQHPALNAADEALRTLRAQATDRQAIAVGTIRRHNGRTTTLTVTPTGISGRITPTPRNGATR